MVDFVNSTSIIGEILQSAHTSITGYETLTFLLILFFVIALAMMFQIPLEFISILMLPMLLGYMAFYGNFIIVGFVILIFLTIIITKSFILK